MLDHAEILRLEKPPTIRFCALNCKTRLDQFQTAGPLTEDSRNILILATQSASRENDLGDYYLVDVEVPFY
jgi:hypothetical protein